MSDWFIIEVSEQEIRRERDKARELRKTRWWQNRISRGTCHWCGGVFPASALTMDHIVPIVRGGKSAKGNVVASCKDCNNRKKHMLPVEWNDYIRSMGRDPEAGGED